METNELNELIEKGLSYACHHFKKAYIKEHLIRNEGNVSETAKKIGVERSHLSRMIRGMRLGEYTRKRMKAIKRDKFDVLDPKTTPDVNIPRTSGLGSNFIEREILDMLE